VGQQYAPPDVPICGFMNEFCKADGGNSISVSNDILCAGVRACLLENVLSKVRTNISVNLWMPHSTPQRLLINATGFDNIVAVMLSSKRMKEV
jgi:hypothetical protein